MTTENRPRPVSARTATKPREDIRSQWDWVEPSVWTDRMLTALEEGVKGGRWHSLIDKVYRPETLRKAFAKVKANGGGPGVDHQTIPMIEAGLDETVAYLSSALRADSYRPQAIRRAWIPKPGTNQQRPLGIPTVRDRIVQAALGMALEPIFERDFASHSYGFRPHRGCKDALRRVDGLLKAGYTWVVDADIQGYFDTIPHDQLMARVRGKVADGRVLALIEAYLTQDVMEIARTWTPEAGSPQGAVISPLLSNIYLDPLDHLMAQRGIEMTRYADDFVIQCRSEAEARRALDEVQTWMQANGLRLHSEKTRIVDATVHGGFDFLGYHFERRYRWPRTKSLMKFKTTVRGLTPRCNGQSLDAIIGALNQVLRGWFEYFKHSAKPTFPRLDRWIRMRLRSILRQRHGGRGRGRGLDHLHWPNAYFAEQGLISLSAAHAAARQSRRG